MLEKFYEDYVNIPVDKNDTTNGLSNIDSTSVSKSDNLRKLYSSMDGKNKNSNFLDSDFPTGTGG